MLNLLFIRIAACLEGARVYMDGDMWCVLRGSNIQVGQCAFAPTAREAWEKFKRLHR